MLKMIYCRCWRTFQAGDDKAAWINTLISHCRLQHHITQEMMGWVDLPVILYVIITPP